MDGHLDSASKHLLPFLELEDGQRYGVKIRQAGTTEIRLDAAIRVDVGMIALLHIEDEHGDCWFRSAVEIHWADPFPGGTSVGLYLSQPFSEELMAWHEWDRREAIRYPVDMEARVWWSGARHGALGRVVNYSSHGVGVVCDRPVAQFGVPAIIVAGIGSDRIVCANGSACWQVQAVEGIMIGFELESYQGRRFGGQSQAPQRSVKLPASSVVRSPLQLNNPMSPSKGPPDQAYFRKTLDMQLNLQ
ncbi:MAG: hypothetical protein DWH91_07330 [Planctomycetota bacterium]|nr:MAG: hypothetical protein DWH91_07330 [Planctomycetota bacterium]